ncbi:MAG TPA: SLC13 family permease [Stellaceae bacterium]|nr:SLC13 family permease [Stellaceae bacterium]
MTLQQALSLALLGGLLALFVWDRLRFDVVALIALLTAVAVGIVPAQHAFSGFGNPLLPLIASALIVSSAIGKSGAMEEVVAALRPLLQHRGTQVGILTASVAALSALVKNIGALAIFLPVAMQVARRGKRRIGEFLMPMSFGSLVGGMMTLIGTSPNLIASSVRAELTGEPYRMFDFLPVGAGITLLGVGFLSVGWRLLPIRDEGQAGGEGPFRIEDYISEAMLPENSPLVGKTVAELEKLSDGSVTVTAIIREGKRRYTPAGYWPLFAGDVLVLESDPQEMQSLIQAAHLELVGQGELEQAKKEDGDAVVVEAVVMAESRMIGASSSALQLRDRYGVNLIALSRGGRRNMARLGRMTFHEGDVVALHGSAARMHDALARLGCLPLAERNLQLGRPRKLVVTLLVLLGSVALAATELVPPALAFAGGAVVLVAMGILSLREAYDAIDWPILVMLGALIPIGDAMRSTGTTALIAGWLSGAADTLPIWATLGLLLVITMLLTPLIHHAAAVLVMGPVAAAIARQLGVSIDSFLMAVAVGASCDFLSPIGHQCNTLVMGPGGYRFGDYWHLGLPLSLLVVSCGVPLILIAWPLH